VTLVTQLQRRCCWRFGCDRPRCAAMPRVHRAMGAQRCKCFVSSPVSCVACLFLPEQNRPACTAVHGTVRAVAWRVVLLSTARGTAAPVPPGALVLALVCSLVVLAAAWPCRIQGHSQHQTAANTGCYQSFLPPNCVPWPCMVICHHGCVLLRHDACCVEFHPFACAQQRLLCSGVDQEQPRCYLVSAPCVCCSVQPVGVWSNIRACVGTGSCAQLPACCLISTNPWEGTVRHWLDMGTSHGMVA
jgi:hypothetical protein